MFRDSRRWARSAARLAASELLILPGSKHVAHDLAWLKSEGLDAAMRAHVVSGKPLLAVCGGLQMLGRELRDPHGVEGAGEGLGLLALSTEYEAMKTCRRGSYSFGELSGFWKELSAVGFEGYEIGHGRTEPVASGQTPAPRPVLAGGLGWQQGQLLALYAHGLFENAAVLKALFGAEAPTLEDTFEGLADFAQNHLGVETLNSLMRPLSSTAPI